MTIFVDGTVRVFGSRNNTLIENAIFRDYRRAYGLLFFIIKGRYPSKNFLVGGKGSGQGYAKESSHL